MEVGLVLQKVGRQERIQNVVSYELAQVKKLLVKPCV